MTKTYAGIGARATPLPVLSQMIRIGKGAAKLGYILRSGGADGADTAFEDGCDQVNGAKEIFLPWRGFNGNTSKLYQIPDEAFTIAADFHPRWDNLSQGVKKLMARNVQQILGKDLLSLSDLVVCYTPDGKMSGGTGMAMRVADCYDIQIVNLHNISFEDIRGYFR